MNATLEKLAEQALALPVDERAQLADCLMASLDLADDAQNDAAWAAEAMRRRDEIRSGAVQPIDGEEALQRIRRIIER